MPEAFLGIGSNVDPEHWIVKALAQLKGKLGEVQISPVYRNKAVGFGGDDFLNLVVAVDTDLGLADLAQVLREIERECGRRRGADRLSSRTLDIDILLYGDVCTQDDGFQIPRGEILEAAYVLKPLSDIAKEHVHPVTGRTFGEHWASFEKDAHELVEVFLR